MTREEMEILRESQRRGLVYPFRDPEADNQAEVLPTYSTPEEAAAAEEKATKEADDERKRDLVKLARQRFAQAEEAESEIRRLADADLHFRAGEQWDTQVLNERKIDRRPALVINRIPQFERQITNEQRQARPAINVSPVDSEADVETADLLQGLIRHIEYRSNADVAYDTGLTSAVRGGLGYLRAVSEYESEDSFDQELAIKRVRDPSSIYMDPCAQEPDGSDANFAFVVDGGVSEEQFKEEYPDVEPVKGGWGDRTNDTDRTCQVVEYFRRERVEDDLLTLQPMGIPLEQDPQTGQMVPAGPPVPNGEPITVLKSCADEELLATSMVLNARPTQRMKVCWAKIAGSEVVDEKEFPSKWIPIIPVLGDELWVGGKRILEGVIRNAKDPQRMYNFWSTAITETIALAPKAPYIGFEGQFAGQENKWKAASTKNVPYLEVRPVTVDGRPAGLPQRASFDAPISGMIQAMNFAQDDMKATTGIYDASLGNASNERTGVAIRARQGQSQTSTLHFADNLARALRHLGRILIDAIPRVYSGARVLRILGEDKSQRMVAVNGAPLMEGQQRAYDLGTGKYDVTVSMGPSYTSKRQEAVAAGLELSRSNPQIGQVIADLMVRNMDWPGADEMADRLKKMLPPGIAEPEQNQKVDPAKLQQQLQQQGQMIQQMTGRLHEMSQALETEAIAHKSKERIAVLNAQVELAKVAATIQSKHAEGMLERAHEMIMTRFAIDSAPDPLDPTSPPPQGAMNGSSPGPSRAAPGPSGGAPGVGPGPWGGSTPGRPGGGAGPF